MSTIPLDEPSERPFEEAIDFDYSLTRWRTLFNLLLTGLSGLATVVALIPLISVLYMLVSHGLARLTEVSVFTALPPTGKDVGGGFGNALQGTLVMVAVASLLSVPFGILVAVYLAEFGKDSTTASVVRFAAKILTGLPSIIAGVFAFAILVMHTGRSSFAGGVGLAVLMLPTIILTAEEALLQVPRKMREAAYGLGCTHTQVVLRVVLPTAIPNIVTGVMLGVARAAGETAPLLFTAAFSYFWLNKLMQPTASLAVFIYRYSGVPYERQVELAWAASLVLVTLVLTINVLAQLITRRAHAHR